MRRVTVDIDKKSEHVEPVRVSELLTTNEVAARWGIKPQLLRTWRHRGKGPKWHRIGTQVVYRQSVIEAWERDQLQRREASA